jgi:RNA polymerase sigma factor (sigma-70 family)
MSRVSVVLPARRSRAEAWSLVAANINLAYAYARRLQYSRRDIVARLGSLDDIVSLAKLGLFRAAQLFDEERGAFSPYAWRWMRYFVLRAYFKADFIPAPTYRDEKAGPRRRLRVLRLGHHQEDAPQMDPPAAAGEGHADSEDLARLHAALAELPPRLGQVMCWRFLDELTLGQIARRLGLSKERIRQLVGEGLGELRRLLGVPPVAS